MASYNLNEALKKKKASAKTGTQEIHLDDVSRVKVLSPGRQVFKRFIRNRLAVFGSVTLIALFVFSFLGPLVYPYGQKEIFYKYSSENINYAQARENTSYTGYTFDESVNVVKSAASMMNTHIKTMQADGLDQLLFLGEDGLYYDVQKLGDNIYTLGQRDAAQICSFGSSEVHVGVLDTIKKAIQYDAVTLDDAFVAAASKACKGTDGTFEVDGATYSYQRAKGKSYDIYAKVDGFVYDGEPMGEEFEAAAQAAAEGNGLFQSGDAQFAVTSDGGSAAVYALGENKPAMVYTRYVLDLFDSANTVTNEFRTQALLAAYADGRFTADGAEYTVKNVDGELVVFDAGDEEYADFTTFIVRRYNGEDTMDYELKHTIRVAIEEMREAGAMNTAVAATIPQQDVNGQYAYDEDGSLKYNETEMRISQKDTGEYVINCDQIIYIIDMYASPSTTHILGTDGDGFDVMSRIMYGGRISLMVGFVVVFLECFLGIVMGGLAGYYGGWVDNVIMRLVDVFYCLPSMPIMIILGALMDALRMDTYVRLMIMMAALGIMGWAGVARMVRGQILSLREQEFMIAAEATGVKVRARIFRHLIPNVMPQLIVIATMGVGSTILTESTLSFLGLGVKHPLATWGTIINSVSTASAMEHYTFIWIPVGLLICLTVVAFNFVGDGLRDAYDPKAKR